MNDRLLALGSALAAFVASACCLGPLLLGGLGLGAALAATFAPLRPYFMAVSAALLALGFYSVYHKPNVPVACAGEVCAPASRTQKAAKPILWLATLAVLALAFFPLYGAKLVAPPSAAPAAVLTPAVLETLELKIDGMDCEVCAGVVQQKLLETAGVAEAEVSYPAGRARVKYDAAKTDPARMIAAVNATGYSASLPASPPE